MKHVIRFAEHQEKANHGLGYKLTLTRNADNTVLNKDVTTAFGKTKITTFEWYVRYYTPSIPQSYNI